MLLAHAHERLLLLLVVGGNAHLHVCITAQIWRKRFALGELRERLFVRQPLEIEARDDHAPVVIHRIDDHDLVRGVELQFDGGVDVDVDEGGRHHVEWRDGALIARCRLDRGVRCAAHAKYAEDRHTEHEAGSQRGNEARAPRLACSAAARGGLRGDERDPRHALGLPGGKHVIGLERALLHGVGRLEGVEGIAHARFEFAIVHERASFSVFLPRAIQE